MLRDVLQEAKTRWDRTCGGKRPKRETRQNPRESEKTLAKEIANRLETRRDTFSAVDAPWTMTPPCEAFSTCEGDIISRMSDWRTQTTNETPS